MIALGERIKQLRQRDGRTQEALAAELGVTAQAVSRWEKGNCYPDMELIPSIANYFGISIDELFGYENERSKKVDALYDQLMTMPDGPERNAVCGACARRIMEDAPWILTSYPVSTVLSQKRIRNDRIRDFSWGVEKYLAVDGGR